MWAESYCMERSRAKLVRVCNGPSEPPVYEFQVNPQPASSELNVDLNYTALSGYLELEIYDLTGKKVSHQQINTHGQEFHHLTLETHNINSGMYLLVIKDGSMAISQKKIIVQQSSK